MSLTTAQIYALKILYSGKNPKKAISSMKKWKLFQAAIRGLKKRQLVSPKGRITFGARRLIRKIIGEQ